jgi:methanogenic corrinoid protein MtbC1
MIEGEKILNTEEYLLKIEQGVVDQSPDVVRDLLTDFDQTGLTPGNVLDALTSGIEKVQNQFRNDLVSIPEILLSIDAFKTGVKCLESISPGFSKQDGAAVILIGVVEGDVHDLGKNMVASVLDASGFHVVDLGREVTRDMVVQGIVKNDPSLVALSSMMSTSLENMKKIIRQIRREFPDMKFLVGGAALDEKIAQAIGSDGYADSAVTAPEEAERILRIGVRTGCTE